MNRRHFGKLLSLGGVVALAALASGTTFLTGCGAVPVSTFVSMGLQLLGTVIPTIPGIIAALSTLSGKTITAEQVQQLITVFQGVQDLFGQANAALTQFNTNNDPNLIAKIQDVLQQIKSRLSSVIVDVQIKDPGTIQKVEAVVGAFVDLTNNVLAILPQVVNGKLVARKVPHARVVAAEAQPWAARFNAAVGAPTGNNVVDSAFANVKAVVALPPYGGKN